MTATEEVVVKKKLKIKFATKRIGSEPVQSVSLINEWGHGVSHEYNVVNSQINPQNCIVGHSFTENIGDTKSSNASKRGPPGLVESQNKRRKMDRSMTQQCSNVLKKLMSHKLSWPFKEPVDPVKFHIPDYFSIISRPMDLGTVKSKLEKDVYSTAEQFAADIRLTFSNAMLYNPPSNYAHVMANDLNNVFSSMWKPLEAKRAMVVPKDEQENLISSDKKSNGTPINNNRGTDVSRRTLSVKLAKSPEKQKIKGVRIVEAHKKAEDHGLKLVRRESSIGVNSDKCVSGAAKLKPLSSPVTFKICSCGNIPCQCRVKTDSSRTFIAVIADLPCSKSLSKDDKPTYACAPEQDDVANNTSNSQRSVSELNPDGALMVSDDELCSSPRIITPAMITTSEADLQTPICEVPLSPKRALRAAMLKSRFAGTILKAQQKKLLNHGDIADPIKLQQEKERLEREQHQERERLEAEIRAVHAASRMQAEAELKAQREKEREAARLALEKMEKTVEIYENLTILKDIEMLSVSSPMIDSPVEARAISLEGKFVHPLEQLGLFMKDDYLGINEDDYLSSDDKDNHTSSDKDTSSDKEEVKMRDEEEGEILV